MSEHDVTDMSIINDFSEIKTTFEPFKRSQDVIRCYTVDPMSIVHFLLKLFPQWCNRISSENFVSNLVDAGPRGQERLDDVRVAILGCVVEGGVAALVDEVHVLRPGE